MPPNAKTRVKELPAALKCGWPQFPGHQLVVQPSEFERFFPDHGHAWSRTDGQRPLVTAARVIRVDIAICAVAGVLDLASTATRHTRVPSGTFYPPERRRISEGQLAQV
jgi:hypothetical protein